MEAITKTPQETKNLAKEFAKGLKVGDVVALFGNLGSGKTTFVQGLAEGLGITRRILSPSFVIVRQYKIPKKNYIFYHIDLYRLKNDINLKGLGLEEIFSDKNGVVVIEWADRLEKLIPAKRIDINLFYGDNENQRRIDITRN